MLVHGDLRTEMTRTLERTSNKPPVTEVLAASPACTKLANYFLVRDVTGEQYLHVCSVHDVRMARSNRREIKTGEILIERIGNADDNLSHGGEKHNCIGRYRRFRSSGDDILSRSEVAI
jgi:hypothetical protein